MENSNRVIKFRAWDNKNREMIDWEEITHGQYHDTTYFHPNARNQYELMQYTGLKDKNGVEIYEGDIMRFGIGENLDEMIIGDVYWENVSFELRHPKGYHGRFSLRPEYMKIANMEVIGNIYENPELLKVNQ